MTLADEAQRTQPAAPATGSVVYRCRNLTVELDSNEGPRRILEGITVDLRGGEFVSIMGRSGTGKTTLLRTLDGLIEATPGSEVHFRGQPLDGPPQEAVFVFQNYSASLLPWRTIEKNAALGLEGKVSKDEIRQRVADALKMVGLAERAKDYPWRLSGGMQQRVQLARGMAMDACVLLMDEPFGALDAMTKGSLQDELQREHEQRNLTIAFVSHDIDEAVYLSDRILILGGSPATITLEIRTWRAARTASMSSLLAPARRAGRCGRSTSTTRSSWANSAVVSPAPKLPVPSIALGIGRDGELVEDCARRADGGRSVGVLVGVDADDDVEGFCQHWDCSLSRGVAVVGAGPSDAAAGL